MHGGLPTASTCRHEQQGLSARGMQSACCPNPAASCCCADEVTDVTINLKDFKAMLGLCENLGAQVRA